MLVARSFAVLAGLAVAGSVVAESLDAYVRDYMRTQRVPAVVWGVFRDGKVVRSKAYGLANVELKVPATTSSVFEIGSVSKQFTATALLIFVEEGRLSLDDRIDRFLADLPEAWRPVTLRQLLQHTSGIPDMEAIFGYESYRNIYTPRQIIDIANSRPMDFAPGQGWSYSNTGYYLAGLILEKVAGKPYGRVLRERIFTPLGMKNTRESDPTQVIPNRAAGYRTNEIGLWEVRDPMQPSACLGAGTLVSNLDDMAKWDDAITRNRLLKPATQELMFTEGRSTAGPTGYGMGWVVSRWRGQPSYEHNGGTAGFSCDYHRFPTAGVSAMVFTNLYANGVGGILFRAADLVSPGISYASQRPIPEPVKGLNQRFLTAMEAVAKRGPRPENITERMWGSYRPASFDTWRDRLAGLRRFELIAYDRYPTRRTGLGEEDVATYLYRLTTKRQELYIEFRVNRQDQIVSQMRRDY